IMFLLVYIFALYIFVCCFVYFLCFLFFFFFFSSRRRHTRFKCDWSSDVCSSDLSSAISSSTSTASTPAAEALTSATSMHSATARSEERRVGKECRSRWWRYQ